MKTNQKLSKVYFLKIGKILKFFYSPSFLREWNNLNASESKYLLQISPPADVAMRFVRSLVSQVSIRNIAILYNDDYGKN